MSMATKTLGTATLGLALMAGVAAMRTPKTGLENAKENPTEIKWDDKKSYVDNTIENAKVAGGKVVDFADKTTDNKNTIPLGAAAALAGLGFVGAKGIERKKAEKEAKQAREAELKLQAEQAEEARVAEDASKADKAERIKRDEQEIEQARLSELDKTMQKFTNNMYNFDFQSALSKFGVEDTTHPIKKLKGAGYTETSRPHNGAQIHTEYYISKDGKIIEAGIKQADVFAVDKKDYNYAYVRVINPTIEGKVCELGRLHVTDEEGKAVEYDLTAKVGRYSESTNFMNPKPFRVIQRYESDKIRSKDVIVNIPVHEQQERAKIMRQEEAYLTTKGYANNYDNSEYNKQEQEVQDLLRRR